MIEFEQFAKKYLRIVDKQGQVVPFIFNEVQSKWVCENSLRKIELKARQQGFSSVILAKKTWKFLLMRNRTILSIADKTDNAEGLLERVKFFIKSFEEITESKIPMKYDSKYEMYFEDRNNRFKIGTAENTEVGRSKTLTDLHLSEAAFYRDLRKLFASAIQALVPDGELDIETTANGFNEFKAIWDSAKAGESGITPLFYGASEFYTPEFLETKKKELGRLYKQEYPDSDIEAFLSSGELYFSHEALARYLDEVKDVEAI